MRPIPATKESAMTSRPAIPHLARTAVSPSSTLRRALFALIVIAALVAISAGCRGPIKGPGHFRPPGLH